MGSSDRERTSLNMTSLNNYSKWDNIQLSSDDDEDCHPNIEKYTWRRLRKQQREQQREKDDQEVEKIEAQIKALEQKIKDLQKHKQSAMTQATMSRHQTEIDNLKKYLDKKEKMKKMSPEDLCQDAFDSTKVNKNAELEHKTPPALQKKLDEGNQVDPEDFGAWHKQNDGLLDQFLACKTIEQSKEFCMKNPQIFSSNATGWILLRALELEMSGDTDGMKHAVRQNQLLQYPMDLAKLSPGLSARDSARSFFRTCLALHTLDMKPILTYVPPVCVCVCVLRTDPRTAAACCV